MSESKNGHPVDKDYLKLAAKAAQDRLPDNHGFILLAVPFEGGDNRIKYISNLQREDAIKVLKEWLITCSGAEEWMRHVK